MTQRKTVVIIGGGVSGALTAFHLRRLGAEARIVVIDPRPQLGLGLAYSTTSSRHLLNVPAGKISALPDRPDHFVQWLRAHIDPNVSPADFIPRKVFGCYIQSQLQEVSDIEHRRTSVMDCRIQENGAEVILKSGERMAADAVVLAMGNFDPARLPGIDPAAEYAGVYRHSAWHADSCRDLAPDDPVILIGSGLTAVDMLLQLRENRHHGVVTAVSRHGVWPERHEPYPTLDSPAIQGPPPASARALLRALRKALDRHPSWRAVIDSLRERTNEFWLALPLTEQKRFARHLQRRWEVVRHRMAPQIAEQLDRELAAGTLRTQKGSLQSISLKENGAACVVIKTGDGAVCQLTAARVINCTGPAMDYRRIPSTLLQSLFAQGAITPGPLGKGIWSNAAGAVRATNGTYSKVLFEVGPARMGTLLESIAVPELREQALELAAGLLQATRSAVQPLPMHASTLPLSCPAAHIRADQETYG